MKTVKKNLFKFNKVIVIESLPNGEPKTGEDLYNDIIKRMCYKHNHISNELIQVTYKEEFFNALERVSEDVENKYSIPILHFEVHGSVYGITLSSGEMVEWEEMKNYLTKINVATGNNLYITSAVCFGGYLLSILNLMERSPFFGMLGAFKEISYEEHFEPFHRFYTELLSLGDFTNALKNFKNAIPETYGKYQSIFADEIFIKSYAKHVSDNQNKIFLEKRAKDAIKDFIKESPIVGNRAFRRKREKELKKEFLHARVIKSQDFYIMNVNKFFMIDLYPENKDRFEIPKSYNDFKNKTTMDTKLGLNEL